MCLRIYTDKKAIPNDMKFIDYIEGKSKNE